MLRSAVKKQIPVIKDEFRLLLALLGVVLVFGGLTAAVPAAIPTLAAEAERSIAEIHMLDATNGWAWSNGVEGQYLLLRTTDGGQTWRNVTPRAFPYLECGGWFFNWQTAWVATLDRKTYSGGLLRTTDGGKSWSVLVKEGAAPFQCLTAEGSRCEFLNANHVVARTAEYGAGSAHVRFFETQDGGISWTPVNIASPYPDNDLPPGMIHLCNICGGGISYFPPTKVIITVGDMADEQAKGAVRLSLSTNLGKTWRELKLPVPEEYHDGLTVSLSPVFFDGKNGLLPVHILKRNDDTTHGYMYAYSVLAFYATDDGGLTWTASRGILELTSEQNEWSFGSHVDVVSLKDVFVRAGPNLYVSHDGARTWRTIKPNVDFGLEGSNWDMSRMDFVDVTHGWVLFSDNRRFAPYGKYPLYRTSDGGATWTELPLKIVP
jgi:photosystem II stability/assembly factor-like uncharacterized protein